MKKKFDTTSVMNELRGQSVFFPTQTAQEDTQQQHTSSAPEQQETPTVQATMNDTTIPLDEDELLEQARRAVKHIGKEAATHRFTLEEKNKLADIEYTYRRQGIRTSENEITRIAINYFAEDYRKNGEQSLLAKVLKRLNS